MAPTYKARFIPRIVTSAGSLTAPAIVCPTDADTGIFWDGLTLKTASSGITSVAIGRGVVEVYDGLETPELNGYAYSGIELGVEPITDTTPTLIISGFGYGDAGFEPTSTIEFFVDGSQYSGLQPGGIRLSVRNTSGIPTEALTVRSSGNVEIKLGLAHQGSTLGFYNTTPTTKPTITGSRGGNAALADLLTKLAGLGLLTDSTS